MRDSISNFTSIKNIANKKILISLGGTYEPIDPIRGITNKSSGKMGLELAKEAYIRGADITLVVARVDVKIPAVFNVIYVDTSRQMNETILRLVPDFDIFISTAAVSDFIPANQEDFKISSYNDLSVTFKPTVKTISQIKKANPNIFLVGFKAEYNISDEKIIECAKKQIENAGTDLVVANDIGNKDCSFGSDNNQVILIDEDIKKIPLSSKKNIAKIIFDVLASKFSY